MKPPAYGLPLLKARRQGQHPAHVHVIFGDDWTPPGRSPRVAVKPSEWREHQIDWTCIVGLPVTVVARNAFEGDWWLDPVYLLAAEVQRHAALVWMERPPITGIRWLEHDAWLARLEFNPRRWPAWWSDLQQRRAEDNRARYRTALETYGSQDAA